MNKVLVGTQFLLGFLEVIICFKLLYIVFNSKLSGRKYAIISFGVSIVISLVIGANRCIRFYSFLVIIFFVVSVSITAKLMMTDKFLYIIIIVSFIYLSLSLFEIFLIFLYGLFLGQFDFGAYIGRNLCRQRILILIIARSLLGVLCAWVKHIDKKKWIQRHIKTFSITVLCEGFGILYFQLVYSGKNISKLLNQWFVFILISTLFVLLFSVYSVYKNLSIETKIVKVRNELLEYNYENMYACYKDSEKIFHDFKTHLMIIEEYLRAKEYTKVLDYINELHEPIKNLENIIWTGNKIIDMILNHKMMLCKTDRIGINYSITGKFSLLEIEERDLCIILDNLIENAIEACRKIEDPSKRRIDVTIKVINEMLLISMKNTIASKPMFNIKGKLKTNKKGMHGIGMESIESIVEKYSGYIRYYFDECLFYTNVILYNK